MSETTIDVAAEVAHRKGQLSEVKDLIPIRADMSDSWAYGAIAGTGDLLDWMLERIEHAENLGAALHKSADCLDRDTTGHPQDIAYRKGKASGIRSAAEALVRLAVQS